MNLKGHIIELLERIGLSNAEAKFYMTVYQNPRATIKDIQKYSKLSLPSAYRAYERLKTLGLITASPDNWRKSIETVSLRTLAEKLAREQRKLRKVELELKRLNNLMHVSSFSDLEEPIQILTDQNQIIEKCYEIVHRSWDHFLCYGSAERLIDVIGKKPELDFINERRIQGKSVNCIITEIGEFAHEFMPNNMQDLRNVRLLIDEKNQDYMTYIYENEVTIWKKDEVSGNRAVVLTDPGLVKNYRSMFDTIWVNQ